MNYTREQKIKYYESKIEALKQKLIKAESRLDFIKSDEYQDWNENISNEIENLRMVRNFINSLEKKKAPR